MPGEPKLKPDYKNLGQKNCWSRNSRLLFPLVHQSSLDYMALTGGVFGVFDVF